MQEQPPNLDERVFAGGRTVSRLARRLDHRDAARAPEKERPNEHASHTPTSLGLRGQVKRLQRVRSWNLEIPRKGRLQDVTGR